MDIYAVRRRGGWILLAVAVAVIGIFAYFSSSLVSELAAQERSRMELWADATRRLASESADGADVDFLLSIIEANRTIPVLLTDADGRILLHRNFNLPEPADTLDPLSISAANEAFLRSRLAEMRHSPRVIGIEIAPGVMQHLYYEDSRLLRRLSLFPYVQMLVMGVFIAVVYFALTATKKAEQNKVWVGLSKETAHQLGTPISSLMAWMDYLRTIAPEAESAVTEMEKDVERLAAIASRFSKIGSSPGLDEGGVGEVMLRSAAYMRNRVSGKVVWTVSDLSAGAVVRMCAPLLEWVMENLIKNAVDAMSGEGSLTLVCAASSTHVSIEITDTGRGIARRDFKRIFQPGFTTRKRGWGLGLTLARRIVETYHHGRIYVRASEPGKGTTFRIDFPLKDQTHTD